MSLSLPPCDLLWCARTRGSVVVIRCLVRRSARLALIGPLAAALALAACGRKGPLEMPPSASVVQPVPNETSLGEAPTDPMFSGYVRAPQPQPVQPGAGPQPPPKKSFFLDWLM
jgi:predicted small lipoprotein YifL